MLRIDVQPPDSTDIHAIHVDASKALVGRATFADVRIPFPIVSSRHLEIERRDGRWFVRDVGSSNGTELHGVRLAPGEWTRVSNGMTLYIVDLALHFVIVDDLANGLTLADSGSLVRQLVLATADVPDDETAFVELLEGPGAGARVRLSDDLSGIILGSDAAPLGGLGVSVEIGRKGERFTLVSEVDAVNGQPASLPHVLRSGDRIELGGCTVLFWDPLEDLLDELEPTTLGESETEVADSGPVVADAADVDGSMQAVALDDPVESDDPTDHARIEQDVSAVDANELEIELAAEAPEKRDERHLGLIEMALVLVALVALVAAALGLWLFFG